MVGGYALRYALEHPAVERVTAIGRRTTGVSHAKLEEVKHSNFGDCSVLAAALSNQDAAIFCLGAYTGAVSDTELRTITVNYAAEFARVLYANSPSAQFIFLSGQGADQTGKSRAAFARDKGDAEKELLALEFHAVYVFRPAYIYPVKPRKEPNLGYKLLRAIYPIFQTVFPSLVIRSDDLARVMVDTAIRRAKERRASVFENRDIRAMAEGLRHLAE